MVSVPAVPIPHPEWCDCNACWGDEDQIGICDECAQDASEQGESLDNARDMVLCQCGNCQRYHCVWPECVYDMPDAMEVLPEEPA